MGLQRVGHDLATKQQERFMTGRKGRATATNPLGSVEEERNGKCLDLCNSPRVWGLLTAVLLSDVLGRTSALAGSLSQKPFWQRANILMVTVPWAPGLSHPHPSAFYWTLGWTRPRGIHTRMGMLFSHKKEWNLATMQVDLKDIMLSDISLTDIDKYHRSHLYLESRKQTRKKNNYWAHREQIGGWQSQGMWG